jgi:small subunit ribosomal protein S20
VANHKQALKRHLQSEKARARNMHYKSTLRTAVKKVTTAKGKKATAAATRAAESTIMHVASKGVIPKKRASRKVSRLAKRIAAK